MIARIGQVKFFIKGFLWAIVTNVPAGLSAGVVDDYPNLSHTVGWAIYILVNLVMFFTVHAIFLESRRLDFFLQWLLGTVALLILIFATIIILDSFGMVTRQ